MPSLKKNEKRSGADAAADLGAGTEAGTEAGTVAGAPPSAGVATLAAGRTATAARVAADGVPLSERMTVAAGLVRVLVPGVPRSLWDVRATAGRSDAEARPAVPVLSPVSACATAAPPAKAAPTPRVNAPTPNQP